MQAQSELVMGVDFGTQSLKVALYQTSGQRIWLDQERYPTHSYQDRAEQNPEDWWTAFCEVMRRLPDKVDRRQIRGMAVCATSSTVLLTDEQGKPLMPAMLWMDQRAVNEAEHINHQTGETIQSVLAYSGGKVSEEWMTAKSLWLKKQGLLQPGVRIMEQLDWIHFRLTKRWVASQCNATCKWNYIPRNSGFVKDFFQTIGFDQYREYWPQEVLPVGERIGSLTSEAADALGLHTDVQVFQGGIDAHIGMLGTGAVEVGEMNLIMGSSFVHLLHAEQPVWKQGLWGPYPDAILPDHWLLEGGQLTCGSLTTWFMEQFYSHLPYEEHANLYQYLVDEAEKIPPGSDGLVVLDSWQGNRTPYRDPYARGSIFGLTLTHQQTHIFRALLEATAYGTKNIICYMQEDQVPIKRLIASGGGTKNRLWLQILSDVTGFDVEVSSENEAGVKGGAVIASFGLGVYDSLCQAAQKMAASRKEIKPHPERQAIYETYFTIYRQLHEQLSPLMNRLAKERVK